MLFLVHPWHVFPRQVRFGYVLNLSHLDPEIGGDSELYCCFVWIRSAMSLLQEHYAPALEQGKRDPEMAKLASSHGFGKMGRWLVKDVKVLESRATTSVQVDLNRADWAIHPTMYLCNCVHISLYLFGPITVAIGVMGWNILKLPWAAVQGKTEAFGDLPVAGYCCPQIGTILKTVASHYQYGNVWKHLEAQSLIPKKTNPSIFGIMWNHMQHHT